MPDDIQSLRERIEVLEFELAEALHRDKVAPLQMLYGLTRQQAALIAYMLDGRIKTYDGAAVAIGSSTSWTKNQVNVLISYIRRKHPWIKIKAVRCVGHYLEPETIARISAEVSSFQPGSVPHTSPQPKQQRRDGSHLSERSRVA